MSIQKAVVMAAGRGSRMRRTEDDVLLTAAQAEAADSGLKCMIPVGRPFLDYVLNALADGGVREVCIIVAAGDSRIRHRYERDVVPARLRITFAEQSSPRGTADAILAAQPFAGNDMFLVLNGDNLYSAHSVASVAAQGAYAIAAYRAASLVERGNIPRERLHAFAVIEVDNRGILRRLVEKPPRDSAIGNDTFISMNLWAFAPGFFRICERVERSPRGELELASAIDIALREGIEFRAVPLDDGVLDLTARRDIASVTTRLRDVAVSL